MMEVRSHGTGFVPYALCGQKLKNHDMKIHAVAACGQLGWFYSHNNVLGAG
jgi:hypothetical protein